MYFLVMTSDLSRKPLGACPVCGASRGEQEANEDGTVQRCSDCETRFEEKGGLAVTTYHIVECPHDQDLLGMTKLKHEFRNMDGDLWDYDGTPPNPHHPDDAKNPGVGELDGFNGAGRFFAILKWAVLWWYYLPKRYLSDTSDDER